MAKKTKEVRDIVRILDDIIQEYKEEHLEKERNWRTYEQRVAERLKTAFRELKPLVHEASSSISFVSGETRGAKPILNVEQRTLAVLIKHLVGKSNRSMAAMFVIFSLLSDIDVSYKTVERFYSDPEVIAVLYNLHTLILKKKGVEKIDGSGDGTGYSLTIKTHYASAAQKLKDKVKEASTQSDKEHKKRLFVYSFNLMDIKNRMYVGFGTSFKSEKAAFERALQVAKDTGIPVETIRLDRYYSAESYVQLCQEYLGKVKPFIIPKSNIATLGVGEWSKMIYRFTENTKGFLEEYFQRNQSESGISEDKKRTGWKMGQKRPDRIDTANMLTSLWHNLSWLG
jgi:transposase